MFSILASAVLALGYLGTRLGMKGQRYFRATLPLTLVFVALLFGVVIYEAVRDHRGEVHEFRTQPPRLYVGDTTVFGVLSPNGASASFRLPDGRVKTIGQPEFEWPTRELRAAVMISLVVAVVGVSAHTIGRGIDKRRRQGRDHTPHDARPD